VRALAEERFALERRTRELIHCARIPGCYFRPRVVTDSRSLRFSTRVPSQRLSLSLSLLSCS